MSEESRLIRNNSATLLVGDTGTGKSSLIATYAEWVFNSFGKSTLLYTVDGGGFPTKVEALIRAGIIWVWKLRTRGHTFETCARASQGYWPEEIINPLTGESEPSCKLLPPLVTTYALLCPSGHTVKESNSKAAFQVAMQCPTCNVSTGLRNGSVVARSIRTPGMENVGGVAFDGLTSMQGWVMTDLGRRTASGELKGEETALGGRIQDGEMFFGGSNRSHYGQAQLRAEDWILESTAIPSLVAAPLWTALEQRSVDRDTKLPIYGPKISGSARTSDVPSWVGNCLGTRIAINPDTGKKEWRLYLTEYREDDNIPHLCKTRALPGTMSDFLADGPDDPPFTKFNMGYFFEKLDEAARISDKQIAEKFPNAPGLPSGKIGSSDAAPKVQTPTGSTVKSKPNGSSAKPSGVKVVQPKGVATVSKPVVGKPAVVPKATPNKG